MDMTRKVSNDPPDITELLETIYALESALKLSIRYLEHPDVVSMSFILSSTTVAKRARKALLISEDIIRRADG